MFFSLFVIVSLAWNLNLYYMHRGTCWKSTVWLSKCGFSVQVSHLQTCALLYRIWCCWFGRLTAEALDYQRIHRDCNVIGDLMSHMILACLESKFSCSISVFCFLFHIIDLCYQHQCIIIIFSGLHIKPFDKVHWCKNGLF